MEDARMTYQDMLNPLFLHPSDGANSIQVEKLEGSSDYRAWKRCMEINLSSRRKSGFVEGTVEAPTDDPVKAEMWETCDNMVINWITSNLSPAIKKTVIYMNTSKEIWNNLEQRFSSTNGSRKYKLNNDLYDIKQGSLSVDEYYTAMRSVWEELDSLYILPTVAAPTPEITKLFTAIELQREESKLFQFLNGLNDLFATQRSQLLVMTPLPSVDNAAAMLQQEELQRDILQISNPVDSELIVMYSMRPRDKLFICTACGGRGHTNDRCWSVIGYPKWHPNYRGSDSGGSDPRPSQGSRPGWNNNAGSQVTRTANSARVIHPTDSSNEVTGSSFSPQQLEELAQLLHLSQLQLTTVKQPMDEAIESPFSGMISCHNASTKSNEWIVDSGASDHMTPPYLQNLTSPVKVTNSPHINLPTGATTAVTHTAVIKMEARKWENLNSECLVNVFGRLDLETKLLDIPLVCKKWYQTLLNPLCWQVLDFSVKFNPSRLANHAFAYGEYFNIRALIKFVVDRSKGCATELVLPKDITIEDLIYVSDVCPSLKILRLPSEISDGYESIFNYGDTVSDLIIKWKSLEVIKLGSCGYYIVQIIDQISLHCPNFVGLIVAHAYINHEVASAIVSKLATINYLVLDNARLEKEHLEVILLGCKELELLCVRNCVGFDEDDEEIIKLASRIKDFRCAGSKTDFYDSDGHISHDDLVYGDDYYND